MTSIKTPSGLVIEDLVVGTGDTASAGQKVSVHYTGWLQNGNKFDSSKDRGQAFIFSLGRGEVIRGWDEGVTGMKAR
jgi:FKBP-type peptidyl-prolyl cis-trans isomerase